jgi:hypothetical protein
LEASAKIGRTPVLYLLGAFDDSGHENDDYLCLCGYIADRLDWVVFERDWNALLKKHAITAIHMKHLIPLQGPYKDLGWTREKRDAVLTEFIGTIRDTVLRRGAGIVAAVDSKHWRLMKTEGRKFGGSPELLCLSAIVERAISGEASEGGPLDYRISLVFDDSQKSFKYLRIVDGLKETVPEVKDRVRAVCFADDSVYPPCQAADILSHQFNKNLRQVAGGYKTTTLFDKLGFAEAHDPDFPELSYGVVFMNPEGLEALYAGMTRKFEKEHLS